MKKEQKRNETKKFYASFLFIRFLILYFCIWIKIPIPVTQSWRDLIGLRFIVVHIIIFFSIWIKIPIHPKSERSNWIIISSYIKRRVIGGFSYSHS